eukprot:3249523-Rhodomonas_salina.2
MSIARVSLTGSGAGWEYLSSGRGTYLSGWGVPPADLDHVRPGIKEINAVLGSDHETGVSERARGGECTGFKGHFVAGK